MALLDQRRNRSLQRVRRRGTAPARPRGELQARSLGAKVEAFDEEGNPQVDDVGELVITEPMPSMPVYFWNDPEGALQGELLRCLPGVWRHGDWIKVKDNGACVIYGRSDSTINRGGIRMGTSEIYSAVDKVEEVADSLVVDVPREGAARSCRSSWSCKRASSSTTI